MARMVEKQPPSDGGNLPLKSPMPLILAWIIGPLVFVCLVEIFGLAQKITEWVESLG